MSVQIGNFDKIKACTVGTYNKLKPLEKLYYTSLIEKDKNIIVNLVFYLLILMQFVLFTVLN